ncbi:hypothetical protein MNBD_NITROSPIRAE01-1633 [hydrothermal vent metagenome]|uniref:TolC family protein n=1 Tax=hydrothermal vent metagenome TaxID=652676 RepID=A0A3B1CFD6_9ZZZZ
MHKNGTTCFFSLFIYCTLSLTGQGAIQAQPTPAQAFSLAQAVKTALINNIDIQVEREKVRLQTTTFNWEAAQFDPTLSLELHSNRTIRSSRSLIETGPSGTNRIIQESQRFNTGIQQRFRTGGSADLNFRQFRSSASFQSVNPTFNGDLVFSFTQPLLKDFGSEMTEGPLRLANTNIAISQAVFESEISRLIRNVSNAYWDLVFQIENLQVQQQTLESTKQLLISGQTKVDLGLLPPIEILVAKAAVASREEAVFIAKKGVEDTEDELRILLNLPEQNMTSPPPIQPTDRPQEKARNTEASLLLRTALTERPEIAENHLLLQNQRLSTKIAKNRLSPSLDFIGSLGLSGLGKDFPDETEQLTSGSFNQWEAGLILSFPIGNHAARADLQREHIKLKQAMFDQKKRIQEITRETKEGLRRVKTDLQRIKATKRAQLLAKEKLSAGNERFKLGLLSSHDLLEFQDDLADAKGNALKATIDYNKSLANLSHVTGTLGEKYQIETISR